MKFLDFPELPTQSIAEGATTPDPGQGGALAWSTGITPNGLMAWNGTAWNRVGGSKVATFTFAGTLSVISGAARLYFPTAVTILGISAAVGTAPSGASVVVDVNKNGTTIFTTQANRPTIAAGTNTDLTNTPDVTTISANDYLTVDVDQIGSGTAGANLTVTIHYS